VLAQRSFLHAARGPVTVVAEFRATPDERRRAYPAREAVRVVRPIGVACGAIAAGTLLVVPGWGWQRERDEEEVVAPPLRAPAQTPSQLVRKAFELAVIEVGAGRPLANVPFEVVTPEGETRQLRSDGDGRVRIAEVAPGACTVSSVIDEARVETSYVVSGVGPARGVARGRPPELAHVVTADRHRVRTGDTPGSIAQLHGVAWDRIARFNWGTADPGALQVHYRDTLGCTRRSPDGALRFDDSDAPGVLLIPRPWQARLAVGSLHELPVAPLRPLFLCLENEARLRIPGAVFQIRFADGSARSGRLGRSGIARVDGVPEGPFTVSYPDELELLAGSLAASVRRALDESATAPLFTLLMQSQEVVDRATGIYGRYFDDLTGQGLAADIDQVVTDPDARRPLAALCALAGLPVRPIPPEP